MHDANISAQKSTCELRPCKHKQSLAQAQAQAQARAQAWARAQAQARAQAH